LAIVISSTATIA